MGGQVTLDVKPGVSDLYLLGVGSFFFMTVLALFIFSRYQVFSGQNFVHNLIFLDICNIKILYIY